MNRKMAKTIISLLCVMMLSFLTFSHTYASEVNSSEKEEVTDEEKELCVNIRKRVQWVDETNGDAKVTLQYEASYGRLSVAPDMNVVFIHDKSGSMDVNYGYNLTVITDGLDEPDGAFYYPSLTGDPYWHGDAELEYVSEFSTIGSIPLMVLLNGPNEYTEGKTGYFEGGYYAQEVGTNVYWQEKMMNNSACQAEGHYYLVRNDDQTTGIGAWNMSSGRNLHNIRRTDIHHYQKITKAQAEDYLAEDRRVVCLDTGAYYDEAGNPFYVTASNPAYFLDITQLCEFDGKWILSTCAKSECQTTDRLSMSQKFFNTVAREILGSNPSNKIAYVPFWGDVPNNGSWTNSMSDDDGDGLKDADGIESLAGVTKLDFSSDIDALTEQINHPFTYNGTNWTRAFQNATAILNNRSDEDKAINTLVLFLSDGMPAGTIGTELDKDNRYINAVGAAPQLKRIDGVHLIVCGVGVNQLDETGLAERLMALDSDGRPHFARFNEDFDDMTKEVLERIKETYMDVYGEYTFYQDKLSSYFSLDEAKLDDTWAVLSSPSSATQKGVPLNVYEAAAADENIKCVYVKSTKTVYWYIGEMTNGTYDREGHTLSFPVKFSRYSYHTDGNNKIYSSNSSQYITYYSNQDPDTMCKVTIETPKLVFNRKNSEIIVNKNVSTASGSDRVCRFVYSREKYTSGTVTNVLGSFLLTIPAGSTMGTYTITGLEDGTYYIYEVDSNNKIINATIGEGMVDYNPTISTKAYSSSIPYSVTKSDSDTVSNLDNYLKLSSTDTVTFNAGADLTIVKEIDSGEDIIRWEHGNPTFIVMVQGAGADGKQYTFYHTYEFTKTYVEENEKNGKVSMSYTFTDIPIGTSYYIKEIKVARHDLSQITLGIEVTGAAYTYSGSSNAQFYDKYVRLNLQKQPNGISVRLYNEKVNYKDFGHVVSVKNVIEK